MAGLPKPAGRGSGLTLPLVALKEGARQFMAGRAQRGLIGRRSDRAAAPMAGRLFYSFRAQTQCGPGRAQDFLSIATFQLIVAMRSLSRAASLPPVRRATGSPAPRGNFACHPSNSY